MNETFKKWKSTYSCDEDRPGYNIRDMQAAFLAGATAMRERCAEVAEKYRDAGCITSVSGNNIAAAIRKIEVG